MLGLRTPPQNPPPGRAAGGSPGRRRFLDSRTHQGREWNDGSQGLVGRGQLMGALWCRVSWGEACWASSGGPRHAVSVTLLANRTAGVPAMGLALCVLHHSSTSPGQSPALIRPPRGPCLPDKLRAAPVLLVVQGPPEPLGRGPQPGPGGNPSGRPSREGCDRLATRCWDQRAASHAPYPGRRHCMCPCP